MSKQLFNRLGVMLRVQSGRLRLNLQYNWRPHNVAPQWPRRIAIEQSPTVPPQ